MNILRIALFLLVTFETTETFSQHGSNFTLDYSLRLPASQYTVMWGKCYPRYFTVIPYKLRCYYDSNPGDYFYSPLNADTITPEESIRSDIKRELTSFIDTTLFDQHIIANLRGYSYQLCEECTRRNEYHVRYSCSDTLYVISGWIGKFISFYRAVPGDSKLSMGQLQNEIVKLSPSYQTADSAEFVVKDTRSGYFCERVDRQNMMRVRNYTITEIPSPKSKQDLNQTWTYNLIEITKFIDKEMIP